MRFGRKAAECSVMKRGCSVILLMFSLLVICATPSLADQLKDGLDAYNRSDFATALKLWQPLAEQGDSVAQYWMGELYYLGRGGSEDYRQAFEWIKQSADKGNGLALRRLAVMYEYGRGVVKDEGRARRLYEEAFPKLRKEAEQGDAWSQAWLGVMYDYGDGVAKDYAEALKWYRKAGDKGNALDQTNLGVMYTNGQGVAKDNAEAVKWYRKAAEQGYAVGQNNMGVMYRDGLGVKKDEEEAVKWFRKAADQGNADAQYNLGLMYAKGQGVAKNEAEAVKWYRKAAEHGYAQAQTNLGLMYLNGWGTAMDEAEAMTWYGKAAEQQIDAAKVKDHEQEKTLAFYKQLAEQEFGSKARNKARLLLEQANDTWPAHVGLLIARIELEISEWRYLDALEYAEKLVQLYPDNVSHQLRLLNALNLAKRDKEAYALFQKLGAAPGLKEKEFYDVTRALLERTGKVDELAGLWDRFAADYPGSIELLTYRAETLADKNDTEGALRLYRQLIAVERPPVDRLAKYADTIRKQSGTDAAVTELDAVVRSYPGQFYPQFLVQQAPLMPVPGNTPPLEMTPRLVAQVGHLGAVNSLDLSPDGLMITAGSDGAAILWNLEAGKELRRFMHPSPVRSACFLRDRASLITGADDGIIRIWQLTTGLLIKEIQTTPSGSVWALKCTSDGSIILSGGATKSLHIWDRATGRLLSSLSGHSASINSVALSPDGRYVATGSTDRTIIVWDLKTKKGIETLYGHTDSVTDVSFTADGRLLISSGMDGTVRLWHLATGAEISRFDLHKKALALALVKGKGIQALVGTASGSTILVDMKKCAEVRSFKASSPEVRTVVVTGNGTLFAGGDNGIVDEISIDSGSLLKRFTGVLTGQAPFLFSPKGNRFITGSGDNGLWEWQADSGSVRRIGGTDVNKTWGAFRLDNTLEVSSDISPSAMIKSFTSHFAVLGESGTAKLRDVTSASQVSFKSRMVGWGQPASPTGNGLWLIGDENGTGYLVNGATGQEERRLSGHKGPIASTAASSDGHFGATGSFDKTVIVWDLATGNTVRTITGFDGAVVALGFVPGTHILAAGGPQQPVRLWDVDSSAEPTSLGITSANTESLIMSPDGHFLLTAGSLYGMRLWELPGRREVQADLPRHVMNARDTDFSPDGKYLLVAGDDGGAILVETASGKHLAKLLSFVDGTWAVVDLEGRYDASNGGAVDGLHWVVGNIPIELSQLKNRYYEPGLLAKIMGYNIEQLSSLESFTAPKLFPEATLAQSTNPSSAV